MGKRCQVCEHPQRAQIELGLARKTSVPALARKFDISKDALYRHRDNHMPPQLKAALQTAAQPTEIDLEQLRHSESEGLLQHLVAQRGRLYHAQEEAMSLGDFKAFTQIEGRVTDNLSLTAKLLGDLQTGGTTVNQLIVSPEYVQLRQALLQALQPYPEARAAVARVLKDMEGADPHVTGTPRNGEPAPALDNGGAHAG